LKNEILFTMKYDWRKKFKSPGDTMKYRVIIVAPLGDGALLVRCQEPATGFLESCSPLLFAF
jgi:hypothetical protein